MVSAFCVCALEVVGFDALVFFVERGCVVRGSLPLFVGYVATNVSSLTPKMSEPKQNGRRFVSRRAEIVGEITGTDGS